jgi:hypothetical protein
MFLMCPMCNFETSCGDIFDSHLKTSHAGNETTNELDQTQFLMCPMCNFETDCGDTFGLHLETSHARPKPTRTLKDICIGSPGTLAKVLREYKRKGICIGSPETLAKVLREYKRNGQNRKRRAKKAIDKRWREAEARSERVGENSTPKVTMERGIPVNLSPRLGRDKRGEEPLPVSAAPIRLARQHKAQLGKGLYPETADPIPPIPRKHHLGLRQPKAIVRHSCEGELRRVRQPPKPKRPIYPKLKPSEDPPWTIECYTVEDD